jgi:hypothetical protein
MTQTSTHPLDSVTVLEDRECPGCGYNLRGLKLGGRCPECGRTISGGQARGRFLDDLSRAPMRYLGTLRAGLALASVGLMLFTAAIVARFAGAVPGPVAMAAAGAALALWAFGVHRATTKRVRTEQTAPDALLDSTRLRRAARIGAFFPLGALLFTALAALAGAVLVAPAGQPAGTNPSGGSLVLLVGMAGLAAIGWLAAFFALAPLGAYLSALADWAGEEGAAGRLRGACWAILLCGSLAVVLAGVALLPLGLQGLAAFLLPWLVLASGLGGLVVLVSILQLLRSVLWAIRNQRFTAGSFERTLERKARRFADAEADHPLCVGCGQDLFGLPSSGDCPACGHAFNLAPAGDPFMPLPERDEAPIPVDESAAPGAIHHTPRAIGAERRGLDWQVDQEIPLADGSPAAGIRHAERAIGTERRGRLERPEPPPAAEPGI